MYICPKCHDRNSQLGAMCPRDGHHFIPEDSLEAAKSDPYIGTLSSGKYVILGLINEGGMGAVYRALQLPVERIVAFKVLRAELQDSDQGQDRFVREARAVSRLTHPNIITLHDFGLDEKGHPFMVMEYAPGQSLAGWSLSENLTTERILHVMRQILNALSDAHQQGIVHRDLKPDNMIVIRSGTDPDFIKLLDFGIARMINERTTKNLTREGEVFGTPHYMAPEQAQGRKDIGPPADIYAVGIMLWELLCGECPFDADTPLAVLFMHINEPLPPLQLRSGIELTPAIDEIIRRATQKDPKDRYQTAHEMLIAVERAMGASLMGPSASASMPYAATESGTHSSPSTGEQSGKWSQDAPVPSEVELLPPSKNKSLPVLLLVMFVLVAGLIAIFATGESPSGDTEESVASAETVPPPSPEKAAPKVDIVEDPPPVAEAAIEEPGEPEEPSEAAAQTPEPAQQPEKASTAATAKRAETKDKPERTKATKKTAKRAETKTATEEQVDPTPSKVISKVEPETAKEKLDAPVKFRRAVPTKFERKKSTTP